MCTLDDIQQDITNLRDEVKEWRGDTDSRLGVIERSYLTEARAVEIVTDALGPALTDIRDTLKAIQRDLDPWRERQYRLAIIQRVAGVIGERGVWLLEKAGKASAGVAALYGIGKFLGWL